MSPRNSPAPGPAASGDVAGVAGSSAAAADNAAAAESSAGETSQAETDLALRARLTSFLKPGERLSKWKANKGGIGMSYFWPFVAVDSKTHLCVLCTTAKNARKNLKEPSNAMKHLQKYHITAATAKSPFKRNAGAADTEGSSILTLLKARQESADGLEETTRSIFLINKLPASKKQMDLVHHLITKLITSRLLQYSAIEWPELQELVATCCLLPSIKVGALPALFRFRFSLRPPS